MKFTEDNKEQAIMLETIVGHTLAKHFLYEIREEPEPNIEELSKLSLNLNDSFILITSSNTTLASIKTGL